MKNKKVIRNIFIKSLSLAIIFPFVMLLLYDLPPIPPLAEAIFDSALLIMLIAPMCYFFLARPLILHINERKLAEEKLKNAHDNLENHVKERTSELEQKITEQNKSEEKISHMAYHDQLTGLPNRRLLIDRLNQVIARGDRQNKLAALLFLDIDHFKFIYDTLGHVKGDEVLKDVAKRLKKCIRKSDTIARHGGDEFTILVQDLDKVEDVTNVIEQIFASFEAPFITEEQNFFLTVSMGVSIYPSDGEDAEILLKSADIALYNAKDEGRNTYQLFSSSMKESAIKRISIENKLRGAIEKEEFVLHFQPQVNFKTNEVVGVEALLRWQDSESGLITPGEFIPLEDTGLIIPIGEWVLRTACEQNKLWQENGLKPVNMSVKVFTRQFMQKDFIKKVDGILRETKLNPKYLELELTESILIEDVESTLKILHDLKNLGA